MTALRLLITLLAPMPLLAQAVEPPRKHLEARADALVTEARTSIQAGGGVQIPAGVYARVGVIAAVGGSSGGGLDGRVDVLARFLFDPFRQTPYGVSAGAGISLRAREGATLRPLLLAAIDVEGRRWASGVTPSLQVGLGGGVRIGMGLRWSGERSR